MSLRESSDGGGKVTRDSKHTDDTLTHTGLNPVRSTRLELDIHERIFMLISSKSLFIF